MSRACSCSRTRGHPSRALSGRTTTGGLMSTCGLAYHDKLAFELELIAPYYSLTLATSTLEMVPSATRTATSGSRAV